MARKPVAIIMGSQSDWQTMKHAADTLAELGVGFEPLIVSAHRTPDRLFKFGKSARKKGFKVVIAGAGGAAHLPGMTASLTSLPVFGVPMNTHALEGKDSLLSILQMPAGIPVGTLAIGKPGAINAALLAAAVLALSDSRLAKRLDDRLGDARDAGEALTAFGAELERRLRTAAPPPPAVREAVRMLDDATTTIATAQAAASPVRAAVRFLRLMSLPLLSVHRRGAGALVVRR